MIVLDRSVTLGHSEIITPCSSVDLPETDILAPPNCLIVLSH